MAAQSCGPSQLGNPCPQGDSASQGALVPETNLGIGNPIHLATGNKYLFEQDSPPSALSPLLTIARHYNSLDPRYGPLGRGWTLNYDVRLHVMGEHVQILQADGSRVTFPLAGLHTHSETPRGRLRRHPQGWYWHWPNGQRLDFDQYGSLITVRAAIPRPGHLRIQRHTSGLLHGLIARLRDEQGHEIRLRYRVAGQQALLQGLDTPLGRWQYRYEDAGAGAGMRLIAVQGPDGHQRRYLYEPEQQAGNPWLPTGIAQVNGAHATATRLRTWHYDAHGRVIQAWQAPAKAHESVRLSYPALAIRTGQEGQTLLQTTGGRRLSLHTRNTQGRYGLAAASLSVGQGTRYAPEGWPKLTMHYDQAGRRTQWHTPLTGTQTLHYDRQGRLAATNSSDGRHWQYAYDDQHRLLSITVSHGKTRIQTRLRWQDKRLLAIEHPSEQETFGHDAQGRIIERTITRPALAHTGQLALHYQERFEYDKQGRLSTHHLPEGGALHYRWSETGVMELTWQDRQGQRHPVMQAQAGPATYRHGNGIFTRFIGSKNGAQALLVTDGGKPLWVHVRRHDKQGRVTHLADWHGQYGVGRGWRLYYDSASRLARAIPVILPAAEAAGQPHAWAATSHTSLPSTHQQWYAWHANGGLAARRYEDRTIRPKIHRATSGLPSRINGYQLRYGPSGRLVQVSDATGRTTRYIHNAHGYRISALHETKPTQYLYVGHRLVAEIISGAPLGSDSSQTLTALNITRRYLYFGPLLAGFIDYGPSAPDGQLYIVHTDPVGTPVLVTDAQRHVRWRAEYSPTGKLRHKWGDLNLDIRLPGQIVDPFTGWHDNLLRTYAPTMGAYLEPDPLGPLPDQQALGYARQQPQRYIDPSGLLLFAFDGTRQAAVTRANVWKMSQRYADGTAYYHAGPGSPYYMNNDALVASKAGDILDTQWQRLLTSLQAAPANQTQAIDIIGYSRGAALARHFGNMIASKVDDGLFRYDIPGQGTLQACVDLRFVGLFDTVAQFGLNGALNHLYSYTISPQWTRVAHAVALHEYRAWFPLTSVTGNNRPGVIEAPFVGAHADIGGGLGSPKGLEMPPSLGDLGDVSLNWMLWQARLAGVNWVAGPLADQEVTDPVLHDYRPAALRWVSDGDRHVDSALGTRLAGEQGDLLAIGDPYRQTAVPFIQRFENWRTRDGSAVGTVEMQEYEKWLASVHGWSLTGGPQAPDMR